MLSGLMLAVLIGAVEVPGGDDAATPVSWDAPAGCFDARVILERVGRLMGRPPARGELRIAGVVTPVDGGFSLNLRVEAGGLRDDRVLVAERCEVLADTAALVAAVAVDAIATAVVIDVPRVAVADPLRDDPTGSGTTTPSSRVTPRARLEPPITTRTRPARGPIKVWTRARAAGQVGGVPGFTGGFELAIAAGTRRWRAELAGSYWLPRSIEVAPSRLRVQLGTITPRVCATLPQRRVDVAACLGPELGIMRGATNTGTTRQPGWIAITAEGGVRAPLSPRVALWATIGAAAPLLFPRFRLVDAASGREREVYRPAAVAPRVGLGVEVLLR